ncbi:MAG TPA: hypothetical protein VFL12_09300 [Thermoanaerobaculia bacterium]|nr:hypothetical protein [Thermoanaerobaculia bacterium]
MKARFAAAGLCAALFAAAAPASEGNVHVRNESPSRRDAYVLAIGGTTMTASASTSTIVAVQKAWTGDFLWIRRHGRAYVTRDRAVVGKVRTLFAPLDTLRPEQHAISARERDVDREQEALDRERDRIEDASDADDGDEDDEQPAARLPQDERRLRELDARIAELDSQERALDAQERELDARSDEIEREVEAKLWTLIDGWIADGTALPAEDPARR